MAANEDLPDFVTKKVSQDRATVSKWPRGELEDKYLRLLDENLVLKKHARMQEEKIKKMATKLLRLVNDKKKELEAGKKGRSVDAEVKLEEMESKIHVLEKQNYQLKEKNMMLKQQLATTPHSAYLRIHGRVPVQPGTRTMPASNRITRNMRVTGPVNSSSHGRQPTGHHGTHSSGHVSHGQKEHSRDSAHIQQLEQMIAEFQENLEAYDIENQNLREQLKVKEEQHEEEFLHIKQQLSQGQRANIQENIDMIRLQREVKDKSSKLSQLQSQYEQLQEKLYALKHTHDQVLVEMENLNDQLKVEQKRSLSLQQELKSGSNSHRVVLELKERCTDLERECEILKEANEKLVTSAFDLEREREWKQRENALKVQIAQLEATLRADVGEKGTILDRLNYERDEFEKMEKENKDYRLRYLQLKQEYDEMKDKMRFFTQDSRVDFKEIEEALVLVKKRKEKESQDLDFLQKVEDEENKDYKKMVRDLRAEHAETINELEKTRNMLIVQHKINKEYQLEVDAVNSRMVEMRSEYETKLDEYAALLDLRANRIKKLEGQMRDVAYGTRQYRVTHDVKAEDGSEEEEEMDQSIQLANGENLFEIHIKKITLSPDALTEMGDDEPSLFATWGFYEHELQSTPVAKGPKANIGFTSQYVVKVDDFFLHYIQKDSCTLELHHFFGTDDYRTVAACQLRMHDILDKPEGRLHTTAQLIGINKALGVGTNYGILEYWVKLKVPMAQALRLYKERIKALGYIQSNIKCSEETLKAMDSNVALRPPDNVNELVVKVVQCSNIKARKPDMQPSPYCVYQFFDYPDHVTDTVQGSNNPQFNDEYVFSVPVTIELDKYLKSATLSVYIFDDLDPEQGTYIGLAKLPLITLAHDKPIKATVQLHKSDGKPNGTVDISLKWKYAYIPPKASSKTKSQRGVKSDSEGSDVAYLPGEEEAVKESIEASGPGMKRQQRPSTSSGKKKKQTSSSDSERTTSTPSKRKKSSQPPVTPDTSFIETEQVPVVQLRKVSQSSVPSEGTPVSGEDDTVTDVSSARSDRSKSIKLTPVPDSLAVQTTAENLSDTNFDEEGDSISGTPVTQRSDRSESESDVVMPSPKLGSTLANIPLSDVVKVGVNHLTLDEDTRVVDDPTVKQLFVEYRFLGIASEETECPYALPKPEPGIPINFNFLKVFYVDFEQHYERRQYLASMLLPSDPDDGKVKFTIVSEPEDDEGECEDVGYAAVNVREILRTGDLKEKDVPIIDIADDHTIIGSLNVTLICKDALQAVQQEMPGDEETEEEED